MTNLEHERFTQIESDDFMSDPLGLDSNTNTESSNLNNENLKFTSSYKIIILGEQSVGKTSILSRFIDNKFEKQYQCTLSLENKNKNLRLDENNIAQLQIWDTAGEERFRTITRQFYHDSHGALIVYCIDDRSSFDKINSWIIDLKNNAPEDCVIMIVGNKSDLNYNRKVESEEAKNFAEKNSCLFNEVSAKNGSNIAMVFEQLAFKIFNVQKEREKLGEKVMRKNERKGKKLEDIDPDIHNDNKKNKCCLGK
jgi:small GTP-binding protein